jgi:hypothetical protein
MSSASWHELTVLITLKFGGHHWERLTKALAGARILRFEHRDEAGFDAALAQADIAILAADPDEAVLRAPRLRWIHVDHASRARSHRIRGPIGSRACRARRLFCVGTCL